MATALSYPMIEFASGVFWLISIIFVHGVGVRAIARWYNRRWAQVARAPRAWSVNLLFAAVIASLVVLHLVETLACAVLIKYAGLIPIFRDAYYFTLESYTTLGTGIVNPPDDWRLLGPLIGVAGLFTFGWTSSLLVGVMTEISRLDRARAVREVREEQPPASSEG
ncbi:ion channel [Amaricoccus sp. W119]|uniref:ion channel n=1 Tax=Amaricoccus sp. W119 TaxID=3391833 RepID=UPI0039A44666